MMGQIMRQLQEPLQINGQMNYKSQAAEISQYLTALYQNYQTQVYRAVELFRQFAHKTAHSISSRKQAIWNRKNETCHQYKKQQFLKECGLQKMSLMFLQTCNLASMLYSKMSSHYSFLNYDESSHKKLVKEVMLYHGDIIVDTYDKLGMRDQDFLQYKSLIKQQLKTIIENNKNVQICSFCKHYTPCLHHQMFEFHGMVEFSKRFIRFNDQDNQKSIREFIIPKVMAFKKYNTIPSPLKLTLNNFKQFCQNRPTAKQQFQALMVKQL